MSVHLQLGTAQAKLEGQGARMFAGRDAATCQLAFLDGTLSRRHAELFLDPQGQVFIRDLGSANGTWVDGRSIGHETVALRPGMQVWLGHVSLGITFMQGGQQMGQTVMATQVPDALKALISQRQQQMQPAAGGSLSSLPAMVASTTPTPQDFAYRKQGSNSNGTLLIALKQDTFFNGQQLDGFVEFTSTDRQTVASIFIELVEHYKGGPSSGHVWDRMVVRQGPWRAENGDVLPLPFQLRIPPGTSMSSRNCHWELRGEVDINWASDIDAAIPITMRNQDIERLRDGLGALDFRVEDIEATALGQTFEGTFAPPGHLAKQWGINDITLTIDYLGTNLKIRMRVDKKGLKHDRAVDQVIELPRFRAASQNDVNATLKQMLDGLMAK
jgi:pSer/pThr/pTyr-binding forkhead associated (FHA) protein